ncbi:MAG: YbjN domain-containing protein [Cyanobacteria bacterium J06635_15]
MVTTPVDLKAASSDNSDNGDDTLNYVDTIETVISSLEQDQSAMVLHSEEEHLWKFAYGSVEVYVQLTGIEDTDTLTVWAPVLALPSSPKPDLMQRLLEMNCGETFEACFGILGDEVVVLTSRILADISAGEISRLMTIVATVADENDDPLKTEFGIAS